MDVSVTSVQNWENGKSVPSWEKIYDLAYLYNIPQSTIIQEILISIEEEREDNFPFFLFDKDERVRRIISSLHLNIEQQNLFGIICIHKSEILNDYAETIISLDYLEDIPYEYVSKTGSIQLMNNAEQLTNVLRYVNPSFLLKALKLSPETEFDVRMLPKKMICEFIDSGYCSPDTLWDMYDYLEELVLDISMEKAEQLLYELEKISPVFLTDVLPEKADIKELVLISGLPEVFYEYESAGQLIDGLELVTNSGFDKNENRFFWELNEKGKQLLEWLREKE